jgi:hypothetical protein
MGTPKSGKQQPPGFKTPLLTPHRPPELDVPDGENKRKSSVDPGKLSPRVAASKEGRGPETPRGLFGKIASAAKALTPSGRLAKQQALRAEQHKHAVTVLKPLIGVLIRSATEPEFSEHAGKVAAEALQKTPEKPHLQNTSIAKKQRSAAEAREAAGKEKSAAGNVLRLVTTGLVGVIPMDLEELDVSGIGANPYFDTTAKSHLQRLYKGPQLYTGARKAYHLDFFLRVARSAVEELEQEGRSVAPAIEVIEYILDQTLPAKLHGGEVWALLTIILKAVRHEADSVDEAGAADEIEPKMLFIADPGFAAEVHEAMFALRIPVAEKPTAMESLLVHGQRLLDSVHINTFTNTSGLGHLFFSNLLSDTRSLIRGNFPELSDMSTDEIAIDALAVLHHKDPVAVEKLFKTFSADDLDDILDARPTEQIDADVRLQFLTAVRDARREPARVGLSEQAAVAPRSANPIVNEFNAVARNYQEAVEARMNDLAREIATTAEHRQAALASEIESLSAEDRTQLDFSRMALGILGAPDPNLIPRGPTPDGARFRRARVPEAPPAEPVFRKPVETPDAVDPSIYSKQDGLVARTPPRALQK